MMSNPHKDKLLDALKYKRLYVYGSKFWRAVGGTAEHPSIIEICPMAESGFRARVDKHGRVIALLWADGKAKR